MPYFATPSLPIVDLPADAQHITPGMLLPQVIIFHATAGTNSRVWLSTDPRSNVSTQRLIEKDGTNVKIADDHTICNHVGFSRLGRRRNLNPIAFGIEFENRNNGKDPYPFPQIDAGAAQVVEWWGLYGFLPILSHAAVDDPADPKAKPKTDPRGFPWPLFYQQVVAHLRAALVG